MPNYALCIMNYELLLYVVDVVLVVFNLNR